MGIKGLTGFIAQFESAFPREDLKRGDVLLFDGSGWAYYLLDKTSGNRRELGGDYAAYDSAVREEVSRMTSAGLKIIVYRDGRNKRMKKAQHDHRLEDIKDQWTTMFHYCNDGGLLNGQTSLPKPLLIEEQLFWTLEDLGVEIVNCDGEGDPELAKDCFNYPSDRCFVIGKDSDFFLFKGIRYIPFETLIFDEFKRKFTGQIYSRTKIASLLDIPNEEILVEAACIAGNDFTFQYNLKKFVNRLKPESVRFPEIIDYIKAKGTDHKAEYGGDVQLKHALEFSRALYNLEPLDNFPVDIEEEEPDDGSMRVSYKAKGRLFAFVVDDENIGMAALECYIAAGNPITQSQANAITAILKGVRVPCADLRPKWDDINVAHGFQKVFRKLSRVSDFTETPPHEIYHGPSFHAIMGGTIDLSTLLPSSDSTLKKNSNNAYFMEIENAKNSPTKVMHSKSSSEVMHSKNSPEELENFLSKNILLQKCVLPLPNDMSDKDDDDPMWWEDLIGQPIKDEDILGLHAVPPIAEDDDGKSHDYQGKMNHIVAETSHHNYKKSQDSGYDKCYSDPDKLPIDYHKDEILEHIRTHRVTIIHGETGCGKSSRVPFHLLEESGILDENKAIQKPSLKRRFPKMFVSQPRRIAARALMDRIQQSPGCMKLVGMRLGHGIRIETPETRVWFVTTGYLVRLLANNPSNFDAHTHLIIDEVHERSIDTDILCFLAKRLLQTHQCIKLILMSATLAAKLYQDYFNVAEEAIFVGARRFPIEFIYSEDLLNKIRSTNLHKKAAYNICKSTQEGKCPSADISKSQYELALLVTRYAGRPGSAVLIFVSGLQDITELMEKFEQLKSDVVYKVYPIHGDIPFEEQLEAFKPCVNGEVKVVIATNAAESSITLPDVDTVICLGTCKQVRYNINTHRAQLVPTWISKASATQRAGRTGRVRPGSCYRLYSRKLFEEHMSEHEIGEMHRQPLDSVILGLKGMLTGAIVPILQNVIEPPSQENVARSFSALHEEGFIDGPNDDGSMTYMGNFVAGLGVDLQLGKMIGLGAQFGCLAEAVVMAASLSMPKSPFRIANPLIHDDPDEYNDIVANTIIAQDKFDMGLYSEPLMMIELLFQYEDAAIGFKEGCHIFCKQNYLADTRMRQFSSITQHLRLRVKGLLGLSCPQPSKPPSSMSPSKINTLRLLLVWTLHKQVICVKGFGKRNSDSYSVTAFTTDPKLSAEYFRKVIPKGFKYELIENRIQYSGSQDFETLNFSLENIPLKRTVEKSNFSAAWFIDETTKLKFVKMFIKRLGAELIENQLLALLKNKGKNFDTPLAAEIQGELLFISGQISNEGIKTLDEIAKMLPSTLMGKVDSFGNLNAVVHGKTMSQGELTEFFVCSRDTNFNEVQAKDKQTVLFSYPSSVPADTKIKLPQGTMQNSQVEKLFEDIPLAARMIGQMANGYRDKSIRIWSDAKKKEKIELKVTVQMPKWKVSAVSGRNSGGCFMPRNTLSAAVNPLTDDSVYAVAGSMLDFSGSMARAEGITILPPGEDWLALALLVFGLSTDVLEHKLSNNVYQAANAFNTACCNRLKEKMNSEPALNKRLDEIFNLKHNPNDYDFIKPADNNEVSGRDIGKSCHQLNDPKMAEKSNQTVMNTFVNAKKHSNNNEADGIADGMSRMHIASPEHSIASTSEKTRNKQSEAVGKVSKKVKKSTEQNKSSTKIEQKSKNGKSQLEILQDTILKILEDEKWHSMESIDKSFEKLTGNSLMDMQLPLKLAKSGHMTGNAHTMFSILQDIKKIEHQHEKGEADIYARHKFRLKSNVKSTSNKFQVSMRTIRNSNSRDDASSMNHLSALKVENVKDNSNAHRVQEDSNCTNRVKKDSKISRVREDSNMPQVEDTQVQTNCSNTPQIKSNKYFSSAPEVISLNNSTIVLNVPKSQIKNEKNNRKSDKKSKNRAFKTQIVNPDSKINSNESNQARNSTFEGNSRERNNRNASLIDITYDPKGPLPKSQIPIFKAQIGTHDTSKEKLCSAVKHILLEKGQLSLENLIQNLRATYGITASWIAEVLKDQTLLSFLENLPCVSYSRDIGQWRLIDIA